MDTDLLQLLCLEQNEDTTCAISRYTDLFPPNLMSEEQWVSFVLSRRGVDHIQDFFSTTYENSHIQWCINKPLADNARGSTILHVEARDQRCDVLKLLLNLGGMLECTKQLIQAKFLM